MEKSFLKSWTFWSTLAGAAYGALSYFTGTMSGGEAWVLIAAFSGLFGIRRAFK